MLKFERLKTHILSLEARPDLLIFVETWIVEGTQSLYNIPGYFSYHVCRSERSAGVAVYYRKSFKMELPVIAHDNGPVNYVTFRLFGRGLVLPTFTALYMPDVRNFSRLKTVLRGVLGTTSGDLLLVGDFNIDQTRCV